MLDETDWDTWLDPTTGDVGELEAMLRPAPDDWLEVYPVSTRVNSPDNNDAELDPAGRARHAALMVDSAALAPFG